MSCALTQGYNLDCRNSRGGIVRVYITEMANVTGTNLSSGFLYSNPTNPITTITMAASSYFRKYELVKETGEMTEKDQASTPNGTIFYEPEVKIPIRKLQAILRNEIHLLAQNRLIMITQDRNGLFWCQGYNNGMELQTSDSKTGKAMGDFNGYELVFQGKEEYPMIPVSMTQAQLDALVQ